MHTETKALRIRFITCIFSKVIQRCILLVGFIEAIKSHFLEEKLNQPVTNIITTCDNLTAIKQAIHFINDLCSHFLPIRQVDAELTA